MRPPGYEPGELPTAPLRDVMGAFLKSGAKVQLFFELAKFSIIFFTFMHIFSQKAWLFQIKSVLLHTQT